MRENVTRWDDTELARGATYHYSVVAYNAVDESAPSQVVSITLEQ